jgi:hypothetical protein
MAYELDPKRRLEQEPLDGTIDYITNQNHPFQSVKKDMLFY